MQESGAALSSSSSQLPAKSPLLLQASSTCSCAWLCPAKALLQLSVTAEPLSLSGDVTFCFFGTVQGSRDLPGLTPWASQPLLSHGASHTGKSAATHCGGGKWGKKVIYLRWGRLFCCSLSPCALLAHPELAASRGFVSVRGLTRSSELPHKHKHQRAGVRVFS